MAFIDTRKNDESMEFLYAQSRRNNLFEDNSEDEASLDGNGSVVDSDYVSSDAYDSDATFDDDDSYSDVSCDAKHYQMCSACAFNTNLQRTFKKYGFDDTTETEIQWFLGHPYEQIDAASSSKTNITTVEMFIKGVIAVNENGTDARFKYHLCNLGLSDTGKYIDKNGTIEVINRRLTIYSMDSNNAIIIIYDNEEIIGIMHNNTIYEPYESLPVHVADVLASARIAINALSDKVCMLSVCFESRNVEFHLFRDGSMSVESDVHKKVVLSPEEMDTRYPNMFPDTCRNRAFLTVLSIPFNPRTGKCIKIC